MDVAAIKMQKLQELIDQMNGIMSESPEGEDAPVDVEAAVAELGEVAPEESAPASPESMEEEDELGSQMKGFFKPKQPEEKRKVAPMMLKK